MRGREPFVRDPTREREREREEQAGVLSPHPGANWFVTIHFDEVLTTSGP